jgi:hypothetical protein
MSGSTTDEQIEDLQSAITRLSRRIPRLTIIKEAYLSHKFDDSEFLTAYSTVTSNDRSAKALRNVFESLSDVLQTLDQSSFSTLNEFLNNNDLGDNRELLIEAFNVGPLLLLLLRFPRLQFRERMSTGTKPTTYTRDYYDAFPVFSPQEGGEMEDLVEFSKIYESYVQRVEANSDKLQYLANLAADLSTTLLRALPLFNTRLRGPDASSGMGQVLVQDSMCLFRFCVTRVASLLLSESVIELRLDDNTAEISGETLDVVHYISDGVCATDTFADLSGIGFTTNWKADGLAWGIFSSHEVIFFPVEIKQAIGLESLQNFPYITNEEITAENTYSCIQQLIQSIIASQTGSEGFLVFLSENSAQILEISIDLEKLSIEKTDAKYRITLEDQKRQTLKLKDDSNHTVEDAPAEVEEKMLPVSVKLHRIDDEMKPPPVMTFQIRAICMLASRLQKWRSANFIHDTSRILDALQLALLRVPGESTTTGAENDEEDGGPEEQPSSTSQDTPPSSRTRSAVC